jgi:hypothetical protein
VGVQHLQLSFTPAAATTAAVASQMMTICCIDCWAWEGSCLLQTLTLSINFPRFNFQKKTNAEDERTKMLPSTSYSSAAYSLASALAMPPPPACNAPAPGLLHTLVLKIHKPLRNTLATAPALNAPNPGLLHTLVLHTH